MKRLFTILFLLIGVFGIAQDVPGVMQVNASNFIFPRGAYNLGFRPPQVCGIPTGTPKLLNLSLTSGSMGGLVYDTCFKKLRVWNGAAWDSLAIGTGSTGGTTIRFDTIACDIHIFTSDTLRAIIRQPNGLQAGTGIVSYTGTGFNFFVTAATYQLQCLSYGTNDTTVTLAAADPTFPRFDMIYVDTTGQVRIRSGDPSPNPAQPGHDSDHEIPLTYILVPANATSPSLTTEVIYDENVEWTGSVGGAATVSFNSTDDPFLGSLHVSTSNVNNNAFLEFTRSTPTQINDKDGVVLFIRLKGSLGNNQNIRVQFYNGATPVGNLITLPLNKSSLVYQGHSITTASLGVGTAAINKFRVIYAGNATYTAGFNLDYVYLQNGINQVTGDVILTGDVSGTGALGSPVPTTLAPTGVIPGTYGASDSIPVITVDAKGRLLNAYNVAAPTGGGADSTIFATNYRVDSAKANIRTEIATKVNISDTSAMLSNYIKAAFRTAGVDSICFVRGDNTVFCLFDSTGGSFACGVDTIYRKAGQDSIFFTICGIERAILDSVGGGGGGEVNTASNIAGAGVGIFKEKVAEDLRFKRLKSGNAITITDLSDSILISSLVAIDTLTMFVFNAGTNDGGDTIMFYDNNIYGSFFHDGTDTLIVTRIRNVSARAITGNDSLFLSLYYGPTFNNATGRVLINAWAQVGATSYTSFSQPKIPPNNFVWLKSEGTNSVLAGRRPTILSVSVIGYRKRKV